MSVAGRLIEVYPLRNGENHYYNSDDTELKAWILEAFEELKTDVPEVWAKKFRSKGNWFGHLHFKILSRIFNLRIHFYSVANPEDVLALDGNLDEPLLLPIEGTEGLIDETRIQRPIEDVHLLHTALLPGGDLIHFERILFDGEQMEQEGTREGHVNIGLTTLDEDWLRELQRNPTPIGVPWRITMIAALMGIQLVSLYAAPPL